MSGPSTRRRIKQEQQEGMASSSSGASGGGGSGFFDSLDILATIATQELKSKSDKVGNVNKPIGTMTNIQSFLFSLSIIFSQP